MVELAYVNWSSAIDFPGRLAAVVWTVGCNLRCPFCYNGELVLPELARGLPRLDPREVLAGLATRKGFLDGLVITGGEPTLQPGLLEFAREVRSLGLAVKLDTNGTRPQVLAELLDRGVVDYVALDVKAPFPRYPEFTGVPEDVTPAVRESIGLLRESGVEYELRTTCAPGLSPHDLHRIAQALQGTARFVLQPFFVPQEKELVDPDWARRPRLTERQLRSLAQELSSFVPCVVRA